MSFVLLSYGSITTMYVHATKVGVSGSECFVWGMV